MERAISRHPGWGWGAEGQEDLLEAGCPELERGGPDLAHLPTLMLTARPQLASRTDCPPNQLGTLGRGSGAEIAAHGHWFRCLPEPSGVSQIPSLAEPTYGALSQGVLWMLFSSLIPLGFRPIPQKALFPPPGLQGALFPP